MNLIGRFDRFTLVEEPRSPAERRRLLNHPYRFAELPKWWASLSMALGVDDDGDPAWIFAHSADDEGDDASYRRDVRGWQSLSHPLLPRVLGAGRAQGMRWYATDAVLGAPLPVVVERCGRGTIDADLFLSILYDFASALAHIVERRAFLTDLVVFDGTLDLDGRVHLHTRATVDIEDPERRRELQEHTVANVGAWLERLALTTTMEGDELSSTLASRRLPPGTPGYTRAALEHLINGDARAALATLDNAADLDAARARVKGLFAGAMRDEVRALADWLEDARCLSDGAKGGLPPAVPNKPVRRTSGEWYPPNSVA